MKIFIFLIISNALFSAENADYWRQLGQKQAMERLAFFHQPVHAKNIILFIGDGMGISTLTAARILQGQLKGQTGEENQLFFEHFPHLALIKTYNTNQQVPDSAGTMSAIITGIKTQAGVLSVDQNVNRQDCRSLAAHRVPTFLELAEKAGKSTGIISTARITHATPAATYAHSIDRHFENDARSPEPSNAHCLDIAKQLIQFPYGDGLEVALGGGRKNFLTVQQTDPENGKRGKRRDQDLIQAWLQKKGSAYVWNQSQFDAIDVQSVDHLLGLFAYSHMNYELDRPHDRSGEPSLSQMTAKAIQILQKNPRGFFLTVEAGRIDHAHHATNPKRALLDVLALDQAVRTAYEMSDPKQTLLIVTADHSHTLTISGYPTRGNPILGKVIGNDRYGQAKDQPELAQDHLPYTTLNYANGRGFHWFKSSDTADQIYRAPIQSGRFDLSQVETTSDGFHPESLIPLPAETHSGEDVILYATGPGAALFGGLLEQNTIFYLMKTAMPLDD